MAVNQIFAQLVLEEDNSKLIEFVTSNYFKKDGEFKKSCKKVVECLKALDIQSVSDVASKLPLLKNNQEIHDDVLAKCFKKDGEFKTRGSKLIEYLKSKNITDRASFESKFAVAEAAAEVEVLDLPIDEEEEDSEFTIEEISIEEDPIEAVLNEEQPLNNDEKEVLNNFVKTLSNKEVEELEQFCVNKEDSEESEEESIETLPSQDFECITFRNPHDPAAFSACLIENSDIDVTYAQAVKDSLTPVERHDFRIKSMEHLKETIRRCFKNSYFPTKVKIPFYFIKETISTVDTDETIYEYSAQHIVEGRDGFYKNEILNSLSDVESLITKIERDLHSFISENHNESSQSNESFVACYGIGVTKYNIALTGKCCEELKLFEPYDRARTIRVHGSDKETLDNLCVFRAVYEGIAIKDKLEIPSLHRDRYITKGAKELYKGFFNKPYTAGFKGFVWNAENVSKLCLLNGISIQEYKFDPEIKSIRAGELFGSTNSCRIDILIHVFESGYEHAMFVPDVTKIECTVCCKYCRSVCYKNTKDGRKCLRKHEKECCTKKSDGKKMTTGIAIPYCPIYYTNLLQTYCIANKLKYVPKKFYMTYDFETFDTILNNVLSDKTEVQAFLNEFSVALAWNTPSGSVEHQYFCLYDMNESGELIKNEHFVDDFIDFCAEKSAEVKQWNRDYFIQHIPQEHRENEHFKNYLDKWCSKVDILGWNSAKFDSNFVLKNLNNFAKEDINFMGNLGNNKVVTVRTQFATSINFVDGCNYTTKMTLDKATQMFGSKKERVKGVYPYKQMIEGQLESVLTRTEPFAREDFRNELKQEDISDDLYAKYLIDYKNFSNFYEYTKFYNVQDCIIMFEVIDYFINLYWVSSADMLTMISFSSLASGIKYATCYKDFDLEAEYDLVDEPSAEEIFKLSEGNWNYKVKSYCAQDKKAGRDTSNNLKSEDFAFVKDLIESKFENKCWCCHSKFTWKNKPTLDRIDNEKAHTKDNVRPACLYCNRYCSDKDAKVRQFFIQLRKFAILNNLPFTIEDKTAISVMREGITGGLSTVHHRINLKGKNTITKLKYSREGVHVVDTGNVITHCVGVDCNSMYPSAFASISHDFCRYTNHRMFLPGQLIDAFEVTSAEKYQRAREIIYQKERFTDDATLFIAKIKGHIPPEKLNKCVNFLPIIRNIPVKQDVETLGNYTVDYMVLNNYLTTGDQQLDEIIKDYKDENDRQIALQEVKVKGETIKKLTQTYGTYGYNGEFDLFMTFSSYYLWFLIDEFDFVVTDIQYIMTFSKHTAFNDFVTSCADKRILAKFNKDDAMDNFYKIILNSSYGSDITRTDKYKKVYIGEKEDAFMSHKRKEHLNTQELGNGRYLIFEENRSYAEERPLQCALFTLDNAKYWYINFIYNFMEKCLDMNKIHFVEGDTDSMYWAIAGNPELDETQYFDYVIKDKEFYYKNIYKWLPHNFGNVPDEYKLTFDNELEAKKQEKQLLHFAVEKASFNMVALASKCYTAWGSGKDANETKAIKVKGVNKSTNRHITKDSYLEVLEEKKTIDGTNYLLAFKKITSGSIEYNVEDEIAKDLKKVESQIAKLERQIAKIEKKLSSAENDTELHGTLNRLTTSYNVYVLEYNKLSNMNVKDQYYHTQIYKFCRVSVHKTALSAVHLKMKVLNDNCQTCIPLYLKHVEQETPIEYDRPAMYDFNYEPDYFFDMKNYMDNFNIEERRRAEPSWNSGFQFDTQEDYDQYMKPYKTIEFKSNVPSWFRYLIEYRKDEHLMKDQFEKCSRNPGKAFWRNRVNGLCLNVAESPFAVLDFDINKEKYSIEERIKIGDEIIERFGLTNCVRTASCGIHCYMKADRVPKFMKQQQGRFIKSYTEYAEDGEVKYELDVFIPFSRTDRVDFDYEHDEVKAEQSFVVFPGSKVWCEKDNRMGYYNIIDEWNYKTMQCFSDVFERFKKITGNYPVEESYGKIYQPSNWYNDCWGEEMFIDPAAFKGLKPSYVKRMKNAIKNKTPWEEVYREDDCEIPNWELIKKLSKCGTIHCHSGDIRGFQLCKIFACYSDADYEDCINFLLENCDLTKKVEEQIHEQFPDAQTVRATTTVTMGASKQLKNLLRKAKVL